MEVVNTRDPGVLEKDRNMEHRTQSFVKETLRQEISTGKIAHGNDKSRNTVIRDVIARLCYCHRAELRMHFFRMDLMEEG